jgi:glutamate--cysteine ligase
MSTREDGAPSDLVGSRDDLVAWIAAGEKSKPQWRIGTEHEKFVFHTDTLTPVPYDGERSIAALLEALISRFGWEPIVEGGKIIALKKQDCERCVTISLEPC